MRWTYVACRRRFWEGDLRLFVCRTERAPRPFRCTAMQRNHRPAFARGCGLLHLVSRSVAAGEAQAVAPAEAPAEEQEVELAAVAVEERVVQAERGPVAAGAL